MKTSELLRACAAQLHPTEHGRHRHLHRIYRRAYLCHIADCAFGSLTQMESALKAAGWCGTGSAFRTSESAPLGVWRSKEELLNTARIIWCLATAKTYEEMGD